MISDFVADQYVTLTANPEYKGDNAANIEEITSASSPTRSPRFRRWRTARSTSSPPQATADIKTALDAIDGVTVITGLEGTYEHVDLQFDQRQEPGEHLQGPEVREAFLKTIPRQEIVDKLIKPIVGDDAMLRNSQIFVPGAEGYDESVADNGSDAFAEVDIAGARRSSPSRASPTPRSASCTRRTTRVA